MTVVALGTGQGYLMTIGLNMTNRMTSNTGDSHRWGRAGKALTFFNGIQNLLAEGMAVTDDTVSPVNSIDIPHISCDMASSTTCGDGDHVMLDIGWWGRMVKGILNSMTVGAIL